MRATDHLSIAFGLAMNREEGRNEKWISISFKLAEVAGSVHTIALQRIGRLDLMLRLLERERLEAIKGPPSSQVDLSLDLQFSLSENWLLSVYEVARATKEQLKRKGDEMPKLSALEHRLALVRMPVAKAEIRGMHVKANRDNPPMLARIGDIEGEPYQADGSYMIPRSLCQETGAALWYPVDIALKQAVAICRHDLSDEMLALFD